MALSMPEEHDGKITSADCCLGGCDSILSNSCCNRHKCKMTHILLQLHLVFTFSLDIVDLSYQGFDGLHLNTRRTIDIIFSSELDLDL